MSCMNIVIVYDYAYVNGGAAKVAIQSAIALSKNPDVKVYYFASVGPVCSELENSDVHVICLNSYDINDSPSRLSAALFGIWNTTAYNELKKLLNGLKNETVVHFHGWSKALSVSVLYAAYGCKHKLLVTLHDYFLACPNGGFYNYKINKICNKEPMSMSCVLCNCDKRNYLHKLWRCCRQYVQCFLLRHIGRINYIYISDFSYEILKPYLNYNKVFYVHDPVDIYNNVTVNACLNSYYVCICRVSAEKGVDLFCSAIEELGLNGIVVGDGDLLEVLKKQYKNVEFVGWKERGEILQYIQKARALVFPSKWYETAGLVVLEMLGCGIPCVVPDKCSASQYIYDGVNGVVFNSGDIDSLVKKLKLMEDNKFVLQLQYGITKNFNKNLYCDDTHVLNLMKVYKSLLDKE